MRLRANSGRRHQRTGVARPIDITVEHDLEVFRQALARGPDDRTVTCELADTGKQCDTSYFRFEGDIYRFEYRYFDSAGRLVGQRNATDYPEYCDGRAWRSSPARYPTATSPRVT